MANESEQEMCETLADIEADLRVMARKFIGYHGVGWCEGGRLMSLADRIDAAAKREREAARAYWTKKRRDTIAEHDRYCSPVGNAAAMHAALIEMRDHADKKIGVTCNVDLLAEYGWFVQKINAALAEPPRNCDIHPKRDEASKAFQETVLTERERERAKKYPLTVMDWFIDWLLATQEGGDK